MTLVYDLKIQQIRPYYINDNIFCRAKLCCYSYCDSIFYLFLYYGSNVFLQHIIVYYMACSYIICIYHDNKLYSSIMHDITLCYIVFQKLVLYHMLLYIIQTILHFLCCIMQYYIALLYVIVVVIQKTLCRKENNWLISSQQALRIYWRQSHSVGWQMADARR